MTNKLKTHFPIIRDREEIRNLIRDSKTLESTFQQWTNSQQNEFLDFTSGARGVKILYDSFFKEIMNPEYYPERLNDLLSVILGINVKIVQVLPLDSTRLGEETSLVTMDIVVRTDDGSLINVEVQKIGYRFPGERSACYSSDLLLRQYKRLKDSCDSKKMFNYKDIKPVYTIVFFEKSPDYFKSFPNRFIHRFHQVSDTGLEIELLQKYIFVPLDIYLEMSKNIDTKLDAWLTFLGSDKVEDILQLITKYPEFKPMYKTLYEMCANIEGVMNMFSKELSELDRNTVLFMVDEYQKEVDDLKVQKKEYKKELDNLKIQKKEYKKELDNLKIQKDELKKANVELKQTNSELEQTNSELEQTNSELEQTNSELEQTNSELEQTNSELEQTNSELEQTNSELSVLLSEKNNYIATLEAKLKNL